MFCFFAAIQDSPKFPFIRAERRRLRDWLSTNIPVQWGKRVQLIEDDDHGVTVHFEDGGSAKGDILVGADGINSVGRSNYTIHRQEISRMCLRESMG